MIVHAPPAAPRSGFAALAPDFDARLLSRIEDAGLNASAPPQQRVLGGWILRLSPGKAKRARCVNALAVGRLPLEELLARTEAVYTQARLPFIVRITPFTQPATLDAVLAGRGFVAFDDTRVMVREDLSGVDEPSPPHGCNFETPGHGAFAEAVGALRGSPLAQRQAHAERLRASPARYAGVLLKRGSEVVACGQMALEDDLVGLYDIHTALAYRRRGLGFAICEHLLHKAHRLGGRVAYLQVDADNEAARQLYGQLEFVDGYAYHYRGRQPPAAG
jgi:ribosomal protein S18 acetylase RimI-like enzyme